MLQRLLSGCATCLGGVLLQASESGKDFGWERVAYLSMMRSEELLQMLCALLENCCSGQAQS